jgi:choline dehydrogenase
MTAEGYDYIVCGGGSSGCLVTARLAEAGARVLLLEAGPDDQNPLIRMPAGYVKLLGAERYMWFYKSVPQAHLGGRTPIVPQGRVLGGGSSVNAMVYIRGQRGDYDRWVEATGDAGWGYDALLPYFMGMEDNERLNDRFHGIGGPWKVSDEAYTCQLTRAFLLAAQGIGLPYNPDFNGESQRGVGTWQITARNGRRCSAADAFLRPAMATGRITLKTGALVLSVIIETGRAVGVRYREGNETREARAATEVVMAAGAIATPKILMLSGIGPAAHLKEHGIDPLVDQPGVGANLQDHTETPVVALCNGPYGYFGHDRGYRQMRNGLEFLVNRSGPVVSNGVEAGAFFDPDDLGANPSIQQFCVPSVYLDKDVTDITTGPGITLNSCVERPLSKGSIRLASANPGDQPLVDPNYLADPEDLRLSIGGIRRAREILAQAPLAGMIDREVLPGPAVQSDADLAAHARRFVKTVYHPCGTARMGVEGDPEAVVTTDLRLRGIDALRVVDASVMPAIISGNTNSTVLVVAEKAAEFMLGRAPRAGAGHVETASRPSLQPAQ